MIRWLTHYFTALAVCVGVCAGYVMLVARWIETPRVAILDNLNAAPAATGPLPEWAGLFDEDAWQTRASNQLFTDRGTLLFEKIERVENDRFKLTPLTLLLNTNEGDDQLGDRRIVLDAPEGAELRFSDPLDMINSPVRLSSGQLNGQVRIYSPGSGGSTADELDIQASKVRIDKGSIYTAEPVRVRIGNSEAAGRDLTIKLATAPRIGASADSPWQALDRLELVYLDHLTVFLPESGLWEAGPDAPPQRLPSVNADGPAATLSVRCRGSLEFDFTENNLTLSKDVALIHRLRGMPEDSIRCDRLTLQITDPTTWKDDGEAYRFVRHIEATGAPIDIQVPSRSTFITAGQLAYDLDRGSVSLEGTNPVRLRYRSVDIELPRIDYTFDTDNPMEFGTLSVRGAGRIDNHSNDLPFHTISWSRGLGIQPDKDRHVFWLAGDSRVDLAEGGVINADKVQVALTGLNSAPSGSDSKPGAKPEAGSEIRIDQLIARGNVRIDTPAVRAETDDAEVWFAYVDQGKPIGSGPVLARPDGSNVRNPVSEPARAAVERPRPEIHGRMLHAQLKLHDGQVVAADLSLRQDVALKYEFTSENGPLPTTVHGHELRLIETNALTDRIQITGNPARVEVADGYLIAPVVSVLTRQDTLTIDRAGSLQLPAMVMSQFGGADSNWIFESPPKCAWGTSLSFDGKTLRAEGGIEMQTVAVGSDSGQRWQLNGRAGQLEVTFAERVSLRNENPHPPTVQQVSFRNSVSLTANQLGAREIASRHILSLPQVDLYPQTGNIHGAGPGDYRLWNNRRESGDDSFAGNLAADSPVVAANLVFRSHLEGNLDDGRLDFYEGVRIAVSPVPDFNSTVEALRMVQPLPGQARIDCQRLGLLKLPEGHRSAGPASKALPLELTAIGGVEMLANHRSTRLKATASRLGYAFDKDLLTIDGDRNVMARVERTLPSGRSGGVYEGSHIWVRPRDLEIVKMDVRRISAGDPQQVLGVPPPREGYGQQRGRF